MTASRSAMPLFLAILFLCGVCDAQNNSTPNPPTAATQKGTAIGQTINAAISAALPGASAIENIIATIFKKPGASVQSSDTTKVSKKSLTDAVNATTGQLATASDTQLKALQEAVQEITTVNMLAAHAETADSTLTACRALLAASDWANFKQEWAVAKDNLSNVTSTDPTKLGKISDEDLLTSWDRLAEQYAQWKANVDNYSAKSDRTFTLASLDALDDAVKSIAQIRTVELQLIAVQLQSIKAQAPATITTNNRLVLPPPPTNGPLAEFLLGALPNSGKSE